MDKSVPSQQVVARFVVGVVIVRANSNRMADLVPIVPKIVAAIRKVNKGEVLIVSA
jgi:hypothetical protein